ncbi:hypothetical protein [Shewanella cyperi]|uniref:hypothetical protein n=1 Tax=Shewanella cyperi TaxID=2814292 RepID=UPI001A947B19|nr:hypothetical protein [Shewanella cyperi]QSX39803.1 hypothetical protein JYB84_12370 [Shewanella cyperi]
MSNAALVALLSLILTACQHGEPEPESNGEQVLQPTALACGEHAAELSLQLPESELLLTLSERTTWDGRNFLQGDFTQDEVRGRAILDCSQTLVLEGEARGLRLATFAVNYQGTGLFWYLGLFRDNSAGTVEHLASAFLGDRIKVQQLSQQDDRLGVELLRHGEQQAMADEPAEKALLWFHWQAASSRLEPVLQKQE